LATFVTVSAGANYRTQNFVIEAHSAALARQVGGAAETWRRRLAVEWLGKELPAWPYPCHVAVRAAPERAPNGRTRLLSQGSREFVWEITLEGPVGRILDSVLPHEMTHAVFATHFRRPLPRWADEGASTVEEHEDQRWEQQRRLVEVLQSGAALSVRELLTADYGQQNASAMYVQGYSLTQFLLTQGGKRKFIGFLDEGTSGVAWSDALRDHYGFQNLQELQGQWLKWALPGL
jgi:hypothetical protein